MTLPTSRAGSGDPALAGIRAHVPNAVRASSYDRSEDVPYIAQTWKFNTRQELHKLLEAHRKSAVGLANGKKAKESIEERCDALASEFEAVYNSEHWHTDRRVRSLNRKLWEIVLIRNCPDFKSLEDIAEAMKIWDICNPKEIFNPGDRFAESGPAAEFLFYQKNKEESVTHQIKELLDKTAEKKKAPETEKKTTKTKSTQYSTPSLKSVSSKASAGTHSVEVSVASNSRVSQDGGATGYKYVVLGETSTPTAKQWKDARDEGNLCNQSLISAMLDFKTVTEGEKVTVIHSTALVNTYKSKTDRGREVMRKNLKVETSKVAVVLFVKEHFITITADNATKEGKVWNSAQNYAKTETTKVVESAKRFIEESFGTELKWEGLPTGTGPQQPAGSNDCAFFSVNAIFRTFGDGVEMDRSWLKKKKMSFARPQETAAPAPTPAPTSAPTPTPTPAPTETAAPAPTQTASARPEAQDQVPTPPASTWSPKFTPRETNSAKKYRKVWEDRESSTAEVHIQWSQDGPKRWWAGTPLPDSQVRWSHAWSVARTTWVKMRHPVVGSLPAPRSEYTTHQLHVFDDPEDATALFYEAQAKDDVLVKIKKFHDLSISGAEVPGLVKSTAQEHVQLLRLLQKKSLCYGEALLGDAAAQILLEEAERCKWKPTTLQRKGGSLIGALSKLPFYTNLARGTTIMSSPKFKMFMREARLKADASVVKFPKPMTSAMFNKFVDRMSEQHRAHQSAVAMSWITAARFGDVTKVQGREMILLPSEGEEVGRLQLLLSRGKNARFGNPHRVTMPVTHQKLWEFLKHLKESTSDNDFLFKLHAPGDWEQFYEVARAHVREVDKELELRSMRRGRLQFLAEGGMHLDELQAISGHKQRSTLLRYLGWSEKAKEEERRLVDRTMQIQQTGGRGETSTSAPYWWRQAGTVPPPSHAMAGPEHKKEAAKKRLHIKKVGPYDVKVFDRLAKQHGVADEWDRLKRFLTDPTVFGDIKTPQREADLPPEFIRLMVDHGHVKKVRREDVVAFMKLFGVLEIEKERTRSIKHPEEINASITDEMLGETHLPLLEEQLAQARDVEYAEELDAAAFYDGWLVSEEMSKMQAFMSEGECYVYTRLLMGVRYAVAFAQLAMTLLAREATRGLSATWQANIDNVRFAGNKDEVIAARERFLTLCKEANITITEPDEITKKEWSEGRHTWLGIKYDLRRQEVKLADKSHNKIKDSWSMRARWTKRELAAHLSLLFWARRVLGLDLSKCFNVMRSYRTLARQLQEDPSGWDEKAYLCKRSWSELRDWTALAMDNAPRSFSEAPLELAMFVDASKWGWGAVAWKLDSNEIRSFSSRWDTKTRRRGVEHSTKAEPLGLMKAVLSAVPADIRTKVLVFTDSVTARCAHTKGYAADWVINSAVYALKKNRPLVELKVYHIKGTQNPADGVSRGMKDEAWSVEELSRMVNGGVGEEVLNLLPHDLVGKHSKDLG
jgi:hypothetical protein